MKPKEMKKELLELKFNVDSIGIIYWLDAIKILKENPLIWDMCDIYLKIAKKYKVSYYAVEKAMRFAIGPAKKEIQKKYGYYDKIKNSTYLNLIRFKLI